MANIRKLLFLLMLISSSAFAGETVTVSWTPPTENTDGSALTDLDGYWIYYTDSNGKDWSVRIDDPAQTKHKIGSVEFGMADFFMTATTPSAVSDPSITVQKNVVHTGERLADWYRLYQMQGRR